MELAPYSIKLSGTDLAVVTDSQSSVSTSVLYSVSGLVSMTLNVWTYFKDEENEGEVTDSEGFIKIENPIYRKNWEFELGEMSIDEESELESLFTILRKRNKFIEEKVSPYSTPICATDRAVAVIVTKDRSKTKGFIPVKLNMSARKP
jgi:hypothetical protein